MILCLSRTLAQAIQSETKAAGGHECCGLLLGDRATLRVDSILAAANVAADPRRRFEIDPATLLRAHKTARAGGPEILGHYHSHPDGEAVPSATDAAMAQGDGEVWLILGKDGAMRAWQASQSGALHGRFHEIEIESGLARVSADRH
ncbi:MAG TPA: M67 family metallopeptidase [Sphingobium sp.]